MHSVILDDIACEYVDDLHRLDGGTARIPRAEHEKTREQNGEHSRDGYEKHAFGHRAPDVFPSLCIYIVEKDANKDRNEPHLEIQRKRRGEACEICTNNGKKNKDDMRHHAWYVLFRNKLLKASYHAYIIW